MIDRTRRFARVFMVLAGLAVSTAAATAVAAEPTPGGLDLAKYRGKVVMVDFWASWCGPCKLAFPYMATLTHRYPARDLVVITVNAERQKAPGEAFLRQVKSTLPVVWDGDASVAKAWQVNELPATILIDRKGKVRFRHTGFFPDKTPEYTAQVETLVKER